MALPGECHSVAAPLLTTFTYMAVLNRVDLVSMIFGNLIPSQLLGPKRQSILTRLLQTLILVGLPAQ
jgi:hypothetical protein